MIKLKAWFYRKTGIYLAHKEELEYITSKEFWNEYRSMARIKSNGLLGRDLQGLLIGCWQAKHGFYRSFKFKNDK